MLAECLHLLIQMNQIDSLQQQFEQQEIELQNSERKAQEAATLAAEESTKSKAAKEVIKSLTAQVVFFQKSLFYLFLK